MQLAFRDMVYIFQGLFSSSKRSECFQLNDLGEPLTTPKQNKVKKNKKKKTVKDFVWKRYINEGKPLK